MGRHGGVVVGRNESSLIMADGLQSLSLQLLWVLPIKDVFLRFIASCSPIIFWSVTAVRLETVPFIVFIFFERRDAIDDANGACSINPCTDALLPDPLVIFIKLVKVFVLAFELPCDQQFLSVGLYTEQIIVLVFDLFKFYLVQTESW